MTEQTWRGGVPAVTAAEQDLFVQTERQRRFVALAAELADRFAGRAALYDRENTFPFENFSELKAAGYTRLTVPAEWGGEGANLTEMLLAQERLARGDGATALAVGWHLAVVGKLAETRAWPADATERIFRAVAERGALINSAASEVETGSPSRGGRPTTTARRAPGGWILTGRKSFTSLAPALDYAVVSASFEGSDRGGWFLVRMQSPGVTVAETWDALGMRATGSHDLILQDVTVEDDDLLEEFGPGSTCQVGMGAGAGWALHIPAVYLGIARAAQDFALAYARNRRPNSLPGPIADQPHIQALLGQNEVDLLAGGSTLYTVANRWDAEPGRRGDLVPLLGAAKVLAVNLALQVVDRAMRVAGIAGLSRQLPLERLYRDVRAGLHNPPMEDAVLRSPARAALARRASAAEIL
ncbi:MAG: acyl-CoA dehydrogenase family protein [Symbiobacterium sp.]|uniref:acyl-CoA dehydrogenase family protein n=1 Tax=Symbiobacterium sp. TaxID=1971213 RepID=UPI0034648444